VNLGAPEGSTVHAPLVTVAQWVR